MIWVVTRGGCPGGVSSAPMACVKPWVTARAARTASSGLAPRTVIVSTVVSPSMLAETRGVSSAPSMPSCLLAGTTTWSLDANCA